MRSKHISFTVLDIAKAKGITRNKVYRDIKKAKFDTFRIRSFSAYVLQDKRSKESVGLI